MPRVALRASPVFEVLSAKLCLVLEIRHTGESPLLSGQIAAQPFCRHGGKSRNPVAITNPALGAGCFRDWVSAFAGTTLWPSCTQNALTPVISRPTAS